jgi:6-pyruvoyltetrahydropterin/6-carboxytetrahydropterin synthase
MQRQAQITCEFTFEASHQLRRADWSEEQNEAVFGACARLHGHSYRLLVTLRGPIDAETGMVVNFRDVKAEVKERVIWKLDHQHLDSLLPGLTTAENLCYWIAEQLLPAFPQVLHRLELWETRTAFAALDAGDLDALRRVANKAA